ncbi:hypothetical protein [Cysteiniphilum sp. 6C5]|uniref:hypothetical protein n=1 Tax=unclassified Cysteiniphilum TaxID=2610889 RepID=UPI003F86786E
MWQEIQQVSQKLSNEGKRLLEEKITKDGVTIAQTAWHDFIGQTGAHLNESQGYVTVDTDQKTGNLATLVRFDRTHPDVAFDNKPFSQYMVESYDKRAKVMLSGIKNQVALDFLQNKILQHKSLLIDHLNHFDARLVEDKRLHTLEENISKAEHNIYEHPDLYRDALDDMLIGIDHASISPEHKNKKLIQVKRRFADAAATGLLRHNPHALIDKQTKFSWQEDIDLHRFETLRKQAAYQIQHDTALKQAHVTELSKSHFLSILRTGKGIDHLEEMVQQAYQSQPDKLANFKQIESIYQDAHQTLHSIKPLSFAEGDQLVNQLAPKAGDPYYAKKLSVYETVLSELNQHRKMAENDPSAFVELLFADELPNGLNPAERLAKRKYFQTIKGIPSYSQRYLTQQEVNDYSAPFLGEDITAMQNQLDTMLVLEAHDQNIGKDVVKEIVSKSPAISVPVKQYMLQRSHGNDALASVFLKMIPLQKELFASLSHDSRKVLDNLLDKDSGVKALKSWYEGVISGQPQNINDAEFMLSSVRSLARYFELVNQKGAKDAVKMSVEKLITEQNHQINDLTIPKKIYLGDQEVHLDKSVIAHNLVTMKNNIVAGGVPYDERNSFGLGTDVPELQEQIERRKKDVLPDGNFRLTPDKKAVYFQYFSLDGNYHQLRDKNANLITFDLFNLNNPIGMRAGELSHDSYWSYAFSKLLESPNTLGAQTFRDLN